MDCGKPPNQRRDQNAARWNYTDCGTKPLTCQQPSPHGGAPTVVDAFVTQTQDPTTGRWTSGDAWCPAAATAIPGTALLRQQAIRLLPKVTIGTTGTPDQISTAPVSLINIQTILWAQTTATRNLGQVTILGQPVHLRITLAHADWDFGDGTTDTTTHPGKAYDKDADPCTTIHCPDYYGHTYTRAGTTTVTLTITWTGSYSLDGVHYQPITGTDITGPPTTATLTLRQAHSILVTTPN